MKKLKTFDSSYFIGKSHFEEVGTQNHLVLQTMGKYFKRIASVSNGNYWKSKGSADERMNSIKAPNHSTKTRGEFNGSCLKQDSVTFNHKNVVNIRIVYEISKSINTSDYPTLEECLFGADSLTKNTNVDR